MKRMEEKETSSKIYRIEPFITIKEISNLLSNKFTIEILQYLNHDPMRYKELKKLLNCDDDNTLSRRLKELKKYSLITSLPVFLNKGKIYEYSLTEKGLELINFFKSFFQDKGGK